MDGFDADRDVAGELNDGLLVRGRRHSPQDIELTVEQTLPLVRPGAVAAFAVELDGEEAVVVAAEIRRSGYHGPETGPLRDAGWSEDQIRRLLQRRLAEDHEVALHDLVLLEPSTIPKASSGAIQRAECRRRYLAGQLVPARDRHGLIPGREYQLRDDIATAGQARQSDGPPARVSAPAVPHPWDQPIAEFLEPKSPSDVAALLARTPAQLREELARVARYAELGWIEPMARDAYARESTARRGVTGWRRRDSDEVYFVYAGIRAGLMMPSIDFFTETGLVDRNVVMFRDLRRDHYLSGISIEIPTIEALLAYQRGLLDALPNIRAAYSVGSSMGAFPAILAGHLLGLDAVWAFGPRVIHATSQVRDGETWDLRSLLRDSNGITQYHIYFDADHAPDASFAHAVDGLPGVVLHPQQGGGHRIVPWLWRQGKLGSIFPSAKRGSSGGAPRDDNTADASVSVDVAQVIEVVRRTVSTPNRVAWTPASRLAPYLDSFAIIELLAALETAFGVRLERANLQAADVQTPSTLAAFLQRQAAASSTGSPR